MEVLDVEVLLDGEHGVLHHLRWDECDVRPFVSALSRKFDLHIVLQDLSGPRETEDEAAHGCGKEDCGGGNCSSCASGGGCSTCGMASPQDVQAHLVGLREQRNSRTSLL
jgi:hypothetical protein